MVGGVESSCVPITLFQADTDGEVNPADNDTMRRLVVVTSKRSIYWLSYTRVNTVLDIRHDKLNAMEDDMDTLSDIEIVGQVTETRRR